MAKYVDSKELEEWWAGWLITQDQYAWEQISDMIYRICNGIATRFNPRNDEEHTELLHDTFTTTMEKIKLGKLKFEPGRAPVFNLLTTTIFRQLYSKMNKEKRRKIHQTKYIQKIVAEHSEYLKFVDCNMPMEEIS